MKNTGKISDSSTRIPPSPTTVEKAPRYDQQMQLGAWQLWRSLPRPCKLFLVVCIIQAVVSGVFASRQLARTGTSNLQDLILILISAIYFLLLVLDAFWHENGYQLLVTMASGALNLVQLIIYATALNTGNDGESLGVVIVCAILQALAVALARWAYLGFGWRMYSKIACDATLPDAERRRAVGLRLGRFSAVAKLDIQLLCLLLVVGVVNGANPSGVAPIPSLIAVATSGVTLAAAWLSVCWIAVASARPTLSLAAEFTYPLCYIVAAAFMFSSVVNSASLGQLHGQVYLIVYPILFVASQTWVWWDARLLSGSEIARQQRDFAAKTKANRKLGGGQLAPGNTRGGGGVINGGGADVHMHIPAEILPLVHGAWLLKLPSAGGIGNSASGDQSVHSSPTKRTLKELWAAAKGATRSGRWRYFQLSHDGSTLRWDWRKFVLLVHIESVSCCTEDLTITLSLTLEPDLRLKFPNSELHSTWARGLTLLVMLLGNPDGLEGRRSDVPSILLGGGLGAQGRRGSVGSRDSTFSGSAVEPGSPNRVLYRLASASGRASAAGLLTKEALEYAAWQARKALKDCSQPPSPDASFDGKSFGKERIIDLEKGAMDGHARGHIPDSRMIEKQSSTGTNSTTDSSTESGTSNGEYTVISMHASTAESPRRAGQQPGSGGGAVLRQRTPTRRNGTPPLPFGTASGGELSPSPSKTKRRRPEPSWLRRTLTAPVSTIASGLQHATTGAARQLNYVIAQPAEMPYSSPFDVEANAGRGNSNGYSPTHGQRLFATPPRSTGLPGVVPGHGQGPTLPAAHNRSRSFHNTSSMEITQGIMPPVPEGIGSCNPVPPLPPPATLQHQQQQQQAFNSLEPANIAAAVAVSGVPVGAQCINPWGSVVPPVVPSNTNGVYHHVIRHHQSLGSSNTSPAGSAGGGSGTKANGLPRSRSTSPLKPPPLPSISVTAVAGGIPTGPIIPHQQQQQQYQPAVPLAHYASAPMYSLQRALSGIEGTGTATGTVITNNGTVVESEQPISGGFLPALPAGPMAALQRMGSDSSWHVQSPGTMAPGPTSGSTLVRYDSLGPQIAPGSNLWQAMFDAGMVYQMNNAAAAIGGGSREGSPSPTATPMSVTRSVAVNMELIDFEQLTFGRMLGEGAEGPVYAAWFHETPVAVKRASCQAEVDLHLHAGWHDNVVNLRGLAQQGGHTYLVMELCPRGTLDVLIHQGGSSASPLKMDPAKLLPIVRSIARGMLHLHTRSPPVLHRDLKPANIFIGHGYVMKIGDFGMARYAADTRAHRAVQAHLDPGKYGTGTAPLMRTLTPGVIGTAAYCAPELLHPETPKAMEEFNEEQLLKADVYSFGVLLWELLERKRPYSGLDGFQIQTQWVLDPGSMKLKPPKVPETCKTAAAKKVVQTLSDLVAACTAWDPEERPSFKDILATLRGAGQEGDGPPTPAAHLASPF